MDLFFHNIAGLIMADCACGSLIFISFIDIPSLVYEEHKYLNWSTYASVRASTCRFPGATEAKPFATPRGTV